MSMRWMGWMMAASLVLPGIARAEEKLLGAAGHPEAAPMHPFASTTAPAKAPLAAKAKTPPKKHATPAKAKAHKKKKPA